MIRLQTHSVRRVAWRAVGAAIFLAVWSIGAALVDVELILPAPRDVVGVFGELLSTTPWAHIVAATALRAAGAFLIAVAVAVPLGAAAGFRLVIDDVSAASIAVARSLPFISVILLMIVWFPSGTVPVAVAVLMAVPVLFDGARAAARATDRRLLEMTDSFAVPPVRRLVRVVAPSVVRGCVGSLASAAGIVWKVTVAAEALSRPDVAIGTMLADARQFLRADLVIAWTVILVAAAALPPRIVHAVGRVIAAVMRAQRRDAAARGAAPTTVVAGARRVPDGEVPAAAAPGGDAPATPLQRGRAVRLEGAVVRYDPRIVLAPLTLSVATAAVTVVFGRSGVGKTTLLRLVAGLQRPDRGRVDRPGGRVGVVFQEPRLVPWLDAAANVALVDRRPGTARVRARAYLADVGLVTNDRPSAQSGGMQQRTAIARAIAAEPDLLVLDEMLSAVEEDTRERVARLIVDRARTRGTTVVVATHDIDLGLAIADRVIVLAASDGGAVIGLDVERGDGFPPGIRASLVEALGSVAEAR